MVRLLRALFARIKAMFVADAALEIQAEIAARGAERKADLYRLAARYDEEGLASVAHDLRRQAEALDLSQAIMGDVVPAVDVLVNDDPRPPMAAVATNGSPTAAALAEPAEPLAKSSPRSRHRKV